MRSITSGSTEVDAMGSINITGNIIPHQWYKTILRDNGKPYLLAISLLADIVYWYRPVEVRDEASGHVVGWRKKFRGEYLQKTYDNYAEFYGESKRSVKAALDHLEKMEVIKKIFRNLVLANGTKVPNIMYIVLNPKRLQEITYPETVQGKTSGTGVQKSAGDVGYPTKECMTPSEEMYDGMPIDDGNISENSEYAVHFDESCPSGDSQTVPQNDVISPSTSVGTNTENTGENTDEEYPSIIPIRSKRADLRIRPAADEMDQMSREAEEYRRLVYENTNYYWHMENDDIAKRDTYADLVELICDVVCAKHKEPIYVNRTAMPPDVVKSRLLKLNDSHIEYVIRCLEKNPNYSGIGSMRNYTLTCLYNAPVTINTYYQQEFNHDVYGGGWQENRVV